MDEPSPRWHLRDRLLEMDEARNARPRVVQQPSEMVKERDAQLARAADKIAALRRTRESVRNAQSHSDEYMARKRELIDTGTDKRYVRRNKRGTSFVESDDVGRSLAADRKQHAKTKAKPGCGDKGDRPRRKTKTKRKAVGNAPRRKGAARKSAVKARAKRLR
jgi:hypothetical protein